MLLRGAKGKPETQFGTEHLRNCVRSLRLCVLRTHRARHVLQPPDPTRPGPAPQRDPVARPGRKSPRDLQTATPPKGRAPGPALLLVFLRSPGRSACGTRLTAPSCEAEREPCERGRSPPPAPGAQRPPRPPTAPRPPPREAWDRDPAGVGRRSLAPSLNLQSPRPAPHRRAHADFLENAGPPLPGWCRRPPSGPAGTARL